MSALPSMPAPLGLRHVWRLMPEHAEGIIRYYEATMRGPSPLTAGERELVYAYCAWLNGCRYAYTSHSAAAMELGIPPALFAGISRDPDGIPCDPAIRPVLSYVQKLTLACDSVRPSDTEPLYAAGWDERAVLGIVAVCALGNWMARILNGLGASADDDVQRSNGRRLAAEGYLPAAAAVRS